MIVQLDFIAKSCNQNDKIRWQGNINSRTLQRHMAFFIKTRWTELSQHQKIETNKSQKNLMFHKENKI